MRNIRLRLIDSGLPVFISELFIILSRLKSLGRQAAARLRLDKSPRAMPAARRVSAIDHRLEESPLASSGLQPSEALDRTALARSFLKGEGIEIGALHQPLDLPLEVHVRYLDRMTVEDLRQQYPDLSDYPLVNVDIIDDGEQLSSVPDSSQDFVIANHFLEHCQNPIKALINLFRVVRATGVLYMAIPDKRFSFDIDRPITSWDHVLRDYREGPAWSKDAHFEEYVRLVHKAPADQMSPQVNNMMDQDYSIHFHVWDQDSLFEFLLSFKRLTGITFDIESATKCGAEMIFILRKSGAPSDNSPDFEAVAPPTQ